MFGAGVGYHEDYFRLFGVPTRRKNARFDEVMQVVEGAWANERFSHLGDFYQYDDILLTPKPYQQPRPPIWIGALFDNGIERATNWDGWIWDHQPEIETARERIAFWRWTITSIESPLSSRLSVIYGRQRIATEVQMVPGPATNSQRMILNTWYIFSYSDRCYPESYPVIVLLPYEFA